MSEEKLYTKRDRILALREGYRQCMIDQWAGELPGDVGVGSKAAERYPLPKITRPRYRMDSDGIEWRVVVVRDGCVTQKHLEWRSRAAKSWMRADENKGGRVYSINIERACLIADLVCLPTEEVEDE